MVKRRWRQQRLFNICNYRNKLWYFKHITQYYTNRYNLVQYCYLFICITIFLFKLFYFFLQFFYQLLFDYAQIINLVKYL